MKQFFKFLFASILGFFISIFILFTIFILFVFTISSSFDSSDSLSISEKTILEIKLDYELPERSSVNPEIFSSSFFGSSFGFKKTVGLNDLLKSIEKAKVDNKISGIFLNLDNFFVGGLTKVDAIRSKLNEFKKSGKFIIAHGNSINEKAFYLGSIADSIYLTPTGSFEFDGFGIESIFFKNLLDKLEIKPQIFQYGKFKSATEPFKLTKFSDENRLQLTKYLSSVYTFYLSNIESNTGISKVELKSFADQLKIKTAEDAYKFNLVTKLKYRTQVDSLFKVLVEDETLNFISVGKYLHTGEIKSVSSRNRIAVIYAIGEILNNKGDENTIGTENIIKSLRKARTNNRVKAIVLRINSPGGSPLTSDMIWNEIKITKKVKPVVVSVSDLAASGGYYIACNSDYIVAEPTSLVGSIGVYGIIPNAERFFNNKVGITFDRVETSENSSLLTLSKPLSQKQRELIQTQINRIYYDFAERVARGRNMSFQQVDEIGQGRIWSALDALNIGLVDTLGGMDMALQKASELANIDKYKVVEYPSVKKPFEKIIELLSTKIKLKLFSSKYSREINQIQKLEELLNYTGIQARLPFEYIIN